MVPCGTHPAWSSFVWRASRPTSEDWTCWPAPHLRASRHRGVSRDGHSAAVPLPRIFPCACGSFGTVEAFSGRRASRHGDGTATSYVRTPRMARQAIRAVASLRASGHPCRGTALSPPHHDVCRGLMLACQRTLLQRSGGSSPVRPIHGWNTKGGKRGASSCLSTGSLDQ